MDSIYTHKLHGQNLLVTLRENHNYALRQRTGMQQDEMQYKIDELIELLELGSAEEGLQAWRQYRDLYDTDEFAEVLQHNSDFRALAAISEYSEIPIAQLMGILPKESITFLANGYIPDATSWPVLHWLTILDQLRWAKRDIAEAREGAIDVSVRQGEQKSPGENFEKIFGEIESGIKSEDCKTIYFGIQNPHVR